MNNKKAKNVIIVVLIILVLACVGYIVYPYVMKNIEKVDTNTNKQTDNNIVDKSANDYEAIYAEVKEKYKDYINLKWLKDSGDNKKVEFLNHKLEIRNSKLYDLNTSTNTETIVSDIEGTPKYIILYYFDEVASNIRVLTEEGKIWIFDTYDDSIEYSEEDKDINYSLPKPELWEVTLNNKIIDLCIYDVIYSRFSNIYYLLDDGRVITYIDNEEFEFEELEGDRIQTFGGVLNDVNYICKDGRFSYISEHKDGKRYRRECCI